MTYYDDIAEGYDRLHKEEQLKKLACIFEQNIIQGSDVLLDVGCGTGFSLDYFEVKEAYGVDPAKKLVEQYQGSASIQVACAEDLPFSDDFFDVVISVTALQNFSDLRKGLEEIKRVGKSRFILTTLKRSSCITELELLLPQVFTGLQIHKTEEAIDVIYILNE
jgi:ubiquinone/menaquinone biosynthesis C-methylase UbiE